MEKNKTEGKPMRKSTTILEKGKKLSEKEKYRFRVRFKGDVIRQLRGLFDRFSKEEKLTQKELAQRVNADEALISKRLKGEANLTLNTVSDMARAMGARPELRLFAYRDMTPGHAPAFDQAERDALEEKRGRILAYSMGQSTETRTNPRFQFGEWIGDMNYFDSWFHHPSREGEILEILSSILEYTDVTAHTPHEKHFEWPAIGGHFLAITRKSV